MKAVFLTLGAVLVAASAAMADGAPDAPTFAHDVAPILAKHCITCHSGGLNSPFSLRTYADVRPRARQIAMVTASRYMPPWKPEPGYGGPFIGERRLTDDEIDTIQRWAATDARAGDLTDVPALPPVVDGWRLGKPDVVLKMPEPYELYASGPDIFRVFVLPIPTDQVRYIKAIEFLPGTRAVHHANMRVDETRTSRKLDEADPLPGYDGLIPTTAHYPEGYFFGWTPGQLPPPSEDLAWRLNPGTDMVVQLHMRPTGRPEHVQAEVGLYFASGPPTLKPAMLRLGKQNIDIPAGDPRFVVSDSYVLPVDVDVVAVQPHAHYRLKIVKGYATLPDGSIKFLLYIPSWDFDWQDTYRYVTPVSLPKGTRLTMEYTYDNSAGNRRNPQLPPVRVHWGQNSSDEMGDLWLQVVPHSPADLDTLTQEFRQKVFREDIVGYETVLKTHPDDPPLHDDVALLYMAVGRLPEAIAHFRESLRLKPSAEAHFNLGTALSTAGRIDDAIAEFRAALALEPNYAHALNNLGGLLLARGHVDDAVVCYQRALAIDPAFAEAHNNLGNVLASQGHAPEAMKHLRRAIELKADYADAHFNVARVLVAQGRLQEAGEEYRTVLKLRPDWVPVLTVAGWLFATTPDEAVRDPQQAITYAEHAVRLTSRQDVIPLDVLGAAYAAAGRFEDAVKSAEAALDLLADRQSSDGEVEIRQRLSLYKKRQPFIDARGTGPAHVATGSNR